MKQQAEAEALYQAAIQALPEPFRVDGPRLAFEFDDPPGPKKGRKTPVPSRPTSAKPAPKRKRPGSLPPATLLASGLAGDAPEDSAGELHDAPGSEGGNGVARSEMEEELGDEGEGDGAGDGEVQASKKAKGSGASRSKKAAAEMARLAAMDPERRREEEIKKALRESEKATQLQKRLENTMRKVQPLCSYLKDRMVVAQTIWYELSRGLLAYSC